MTQNTNEVEDKCLTWNELADLYNDTTGKQARVRPMDEIFSWAEAQKDKFFVDKDGYLHKRKQQRTHLE